MDSGRIRIVKRLCHVYSDMYHGNTFHSLKYFLVVNVVIIMVIWFLLNVGISEGVFKELLCSYYRMSHLVITLQCGICCIRPFRFLSLLLYPNWDILWASNNDHVTRFLWACSLFKKVCDCSVLCSWILYYIF